MLKKILFLLSLPAAVISAGDVEIIKAEYGSGRQWADVREIICHRLATETKSFPADHQTFGDPAPGVKKILKLTYRIGAEARNAVFQENETVVLTPEILQMHDPENPEFYGSPDTVKIQQMVSDAVQQGVTRLKIPEGIYHLRAPSHAPKHLTFKELHNLEIDASGSVFIFETEYKSGIAFQDCSDIMFRNVTLINKTTPFSQGEIISISPDGDTIDVQVHDHYPTEIADGYKTPILNFYDPVTRQLKKNARMAHIRSVETHTPQILRFHMEKDQIKPETISSGDLAVWRRIEGHEVSVEGCRNMKFINVTLKNAIGAAVLEVGGEGGNYYSYKVTYAGPPEGASQRPLLSGSADGFISYDTRRGPTLENCLFEGIHDDGINISALYYFILEVSGNSAVAAITHFACAAGDEIGFFDFDLQKTGSAGIVSIERLRNYREPREIYKHGSITYSGPGQKELYRLTFDREPPVQPGNYAVNLSRCGNGFAIRGCTIRNKRGRGCLIRGSGTIENCLFENILGGAIDAMPEFYSFSEGPYVENLTIRNNVFRDVNRANFFQFAGAVNIYSFAGSYVPLNRPQGGHRNILIENNRFVNNDGPNVIITTSENVTVKNNLFMNPMMEQSLNRSIGGLDCSALVWAAHVRNLTLAGNIVRNPGKLMKKLFSAGTDVTGNGFHNGIRCEQNDDFP